MTKEKNKAKSKQITSIAIAIVILIAVIVSSIQFYGNSTVTIGNKYSFSEMYGMDFTIEKSGQNNINSILHSLNIEDSYFFGFSNNTNITIDLYMANAIVNAAKLIPEYNLASLKQNLSFLNNTNIESLDFLNLSYYIELCLNLEIELDYPKIVSALSNYYDKETNLFFIDLSLIHI